MPLGEREFRESGHQLRLEHLVLKTRSAWQGHRESLIL